MGSPGQQKIKQKETIMKMSDLPPALWGEFGLRGFPGETFTVNIAACFDDKVYVAIIKGDKQMDFCKGTIAELRGQVVARPYKYVPPTDAELQAEAEMESRMMHGE